MAVTTKKSFDAVGSGGQSSTTVFTPVSIELNNQDDLDVYVTLSGGTRVLNYRQSTGSTTDSNHPQVNDTTGLYFPAQSAGVTLYNYTLSTDNNTITFNSALPSGAVVSIERRTRDSSSDYTNFVGGSTIRHTDVNKAFDESNFTAQEARNKAFEIEGKIFGTEATSTSFITSDEIVDGTIVAGDLASNSVTTVKITDANVTTAKIADSNVTTAKIADANVTTAKIADNAVTLAKLSSGALPTDITIASANLVDGTIATADIANDAITNAKIADNSIDSEHYVDGSIDTVHLADNSVTGAKLAAGTIGTADIADSGVTTAKIADANVTTAKIADSNVTTAKIAADAVTGAKIADDAIDSEHLAADSIDAEHYAAGSVDTTALGTDAVTTVKITDSNVTTAKIAADAITAAKIADDVVNSEHIAAGAVDLEHMSANSVDSDQYVDGSIDTAHIGATQVTDAKLASNAVTTSKITDANVTTVKVADSNITLAKLASDLKQTSISDSDTQLPTSGAVVDYVAAQIAPIGGLEVIATDAAFPNTQPSAGVVISIADAGGLVVNGSGTSTTARTVGSSTVTINNIASNFNSSTIADGVAMMVSSTGSGQIYNYHKATLKEADLLSLSNDINDFAARYRVAGSAPSSSLDEGDLWWDSATDKLKVYDGSSWEEVASSGDFYI